MIKRVMLFIIAMTSLSSLAFATSPARQSDCLQFGLADISNQFELYSQIENLAVKEFENEGWQCSQIDSADCFKQSEDSNKITALNFSDACYSDSPTTFALTYFEIPAEKYGDKIFVDWNGATATKVRFFHSVVAGEE